MRALSIPALRVCSSCWTACAGRYAIITLPGSGAPVNPGEENEIPVTFAAQS